VNRPTPGVVEERTAPTAAPTVDGRKLRGVIPYGAESRDLGGWTEVIDRGALDNARLDDLIATREHDRARLLGRHPTTLTTEDRSDGFAWAVELPNSPAGEDVRVAVERGDLRSTSWRMVVAPGGERWDGDTRHVTAIAELLDVTVTAAPAYAAAAAELRSQPDPATGQEATMADTATHDGTTTTTATVVEDRAAQTVATNSTGGLQVEDRVTVTREPARGLADEFRAAGFPGETATIDFDRFAESRAVTWTPSADLLNQRQATAGALGADTRWAWPAFPRTNVDAGTTSVISFTQTARALATPANTVRAIDSVAAKPETGSTINLVTVPLKQVAGIQTNVPNIILEQDAVRSVIEQDLSLAINGGLDKLLLDFIATSGFQAPGADVFIVSVRKAITTIQAAGYNPDLLLLTPAAAEALDTLVSGIAGGTSDFVFSPGQYAPDVFRLPRRISSTIPAPAVVDSQALGRLYTSPMSLARFEADSGTTNRSNVRLELNACFGGERTAAAVRIAAA
jgi:HK97 family phage prohead protease